MLRFLSSQKSVWGAESAVEWHQLALCSWAGFELTPKFLPVCSDHCVKSTQDYYNPFNCILKKYIAKNQIMIVYIFQDPISYTPLYFNDILVQKIQLHLI
jgi:hypothetical protein